MTITAYLADLNHQGHNIKTFPYAIGCVAAYARRAFGDDLRVRIFKSPAKLLEACESGRPDLLAFSNYMWNFRLTYEIARVARAVHPRLVVVAGGPNYPEDTAQQEAFLRRHPLIDFYAHREGERPFAHLLQKLEESKWDVDRVRRDTTPLPGIHHLDGDRVSRGEPSAKWIDLDEIPSPYLSGLLDEFFGEGLDPLLQFRRGCPFACTFCSEGLPYYTTLGRASIGRFASEVEYVAARVRGGPTLYLADANFGMFKEDLDACRAIADVRQRHGWPDKMNASTGKNQVERIIDATRLLGGALRFGAALQSTDPTVLADIKRSNISTDKLMEAAEAVGSADGSSYSEIILNLPGDTVAAHLGSIRAPVEAGITRIQMYPLTLLPGTEMERPDYRQRFGMVSRYRILPRCFGVYGSEDRTIAAAEIVEMAVSSATMSFPDYLYCKEFHLTVELFYNDRYFGEIAALLRHLGLSTFDFLLKCHRRVQESDGLLRELYAGLRQAVEDELWTSREDLEAYAGNPANLTDYARNEHHNSLATNRAVAFFQAGEAVHEVAEKALREFLAEAHVDLTSDQRLYLDQLFRYSRASKCGLLEAGEVGEWFDFDFVALAERGFKADPAEFKLPRPVFLRFSQTPAVAAFVRSQYLQYSEPVVGMRNVLYSSAVGNAAQLFRVATPQPLGERAPAAP